MSELKLFCNPYYLKCCLGPRHWIIQAGPHMHIFAHSALQWIDAGAEGQVRHPGGIHYQALDKKLTLELLLIHPSVQAFVAASFSWPHQNPYA